MCPALASDPTQPEHRDHAAGAPEPPAASPSKAAWVSMLPVVKMKELYDDVTVPDPSEPGGRSSPWPVKLIPDLQIDDFYKWSATELHYGKGADGDLRRGINRFFHFFEKADGKDVDAEAAADPMWLVAVFMGDMHKFVFTNKLLHPAFSWTRKVLDAAKTFAEWQKTRIAKRMLETDDAVWGRAESATEQLLVSLKGGFSKSSSAEKTKRTAMRRVRDAEVINDFPPVAVMKEAVGKAMATLHQISIAHCTAARLPREAQAAATAAITGILYYNGFGGRKAEWEVMLKCHMQEQLDKGLDFAVCTWHKTSHIYGSLAKWLAPGTVSAIKVYLRLPRDNKVITFLAPANDGVDRADVPHYLHRFAELFLPKRYPSPTVNLFRKWYHTELVRMTRSEERLLQLMQKVDAHSAKVAAKHYVLCTPADDAKLSQAMVHSLLGEPVRWPEHRELENPSVKKFAMLAIKAPTTDNEPIGNGDGGDIEQGPADDLELDYSDGLEVFGIQQPLLAIGNVEDSARDHGSASSSAAAADEEPPVKKQRAMTYDHGKHDESNSSSSSSSSSSTSTSSSRKRKNHATKGVAKDIEDGAYID
jgi:hypothetical protein